MSKGMEIAEKWTATEGDKYRCNQLAADIDAAIAEAVKATAEKCANLVIAWHYKKGGYTELAHTIKVEFGLGGA